MKVFYSVLIVTSIFFSFTPKIEEPIGVESTSSIVPDRIMLTMPGNPGNERAVTWRTSTNVKHSIGQITEASVSPFFEEKIRTIEGTSTYWMEGDSTALGHQVIFSELKPETIYTYRVGDGENWSEWFQFTTSSNEVKPFNFIYLGDFQNDIKEHCSRVIRKAYSHFSNADFLLFVGDIVSRSNDEYWAEFFYAGDWIFGTMPSLSTPGNHEYITNSLDEPRTFSKQWNQIFVNPDNHPENLKGRTYYIDYQGVRFIAMDSNAMNSNDEDRKNTIVWLEKILSENPNQWTILFTHFPVYSCSQGRDRSKYRNLIKPVLEKYGVDLVLQGHDHSYCRGQNLAGVGEECSNPPMYMVSVSGPKMYGLSVDRWSDRVASETQLYQNIEVDGNIINVEVFTVTGELYDSFSLVKNDKGINEVIEMDIVKSIPENTIIPEESLKRYSEEQLILYKEKY